MYVPKIPENSIKDKIEKIVELCERYEDEEAGEVSRFEDAVNEEDMAKWEEENKTKIPEEYKEWLRFTGDCAIRNQSAWFWGPKDFNSVGVPEDYVVIGSLIGDGEIVCFSKSTGKIIDLFEGEENIFDSFLDILDKVMCIIDDDKVRITEQQYNEMMRRLKERGVI